MSTLNATIANVSYEFTFRGEDNDVLCLRKMGEADWRDAFAFIHILTDGSCRHDDQLYNIMMELVQEDDE